MKYWITGIGFPVLSLFSLQGEASKMEQLAHAIEEARQDYGLSAILVDIRRGDDLYFQQAFGSSTTDVPAALDMKVRVGGVCLTALTGVLLQAVDEGRVSLEDTLDEWKPDLPAADRITLRMLANCTAGYGDYVPNPEFVAAFEENPFRSFTPTELIHYGVGHELLYEPGTSWNYSHTNFVILGEILEKIYGQSAPELLKERVIEKLDLQQMVYTPDPQIPGPVLHSFTTERGVFEDSTYWNPSWTSYTGSMAGTVDNIARIAQAILTHQLFSAESLQEMMAPTTVGLGSLTDERYYGLGVGVVGGGDQWLLQNPNFGGYQGVMAAHPESGLSLTVFVTLGQESDPSVHHGMVLFGLLRSYEDVWLKE